MWAVGVHILCSPKAYFPNNDPPLICEAIHVKLDECEVLINLIQLLRSQGRRREVDFNVEEMSCYMEDGLIVALEDEFIVRVDVSKVFLYIFYSLDC